MPPAAPAAYSAATAATWPGADTVLRGIELAGEDTLRDGDRVLYGIVVEQGEQSTARLLRVEVVRDQPLMRGSLKFTANEERPQLHIPDRIARPVELVFTLFDGDGNELQRSRSELTPDWFLQASFVDDIRAAVAGDQRVEAIASARLLQIVRMLQEDEVLQQLLGEVASVPFDLRLLFRRELLLVPAFTAGVAVNADAGDPFAAVLGPRYELPFDLHLNDSVFVRLSATVTTPRGPTGAAAGIVLLRAQQASDPSRQIHMQLLACARGEQSEWQQRGMLTTCGALDEGGGVAFSPDGAFVAMPGARGVVELRDLRRADPSVPERLLGAAEPVGDLVFLDATTLLVGRGASVEVFDVAAPAVAGERQPAAVVPTQRSVRALEMAPERSCFVGLPAGEVERWTFGANPREPDIETVCEPVVVTAKIDGMPDMPFYETPPLGFVIAGEDRDRVVIAWRGKDHEHRRGGDGRWVATELPASRPGTSRARRYGGGSGPEMDRLGKGGSLVGDAAGELRVIAGQVINLMIRRDGAFKMVGIPGSSATAAIAHGLDPSGRFYAFTAPGLRLLVDSHRVQTK